ncbi:MAG: hypothetical protein WC654_07165 [Patescibacteria group bacterium]
MTLPDLEKYRGYMDEFNMTDADKDEITLALWNVMNHFIDQAFGEHSVQLCQKVEITNT